MKNLILAVVFLLGLAVIFAQFGNAEQVLEVLRRGDWRWLLLALVVQLIWQFNQAVTMRAVYRTLDQTLHLGRLLLLGVSASFLNVAAPSAGLGGMALYILDARRAGLSSARATLANVLGLLYDYMAFLVVLALGLVVLFRRSDLSIADVMATSLLLLMALGLLGLLYLGDRSEAALEGMLVGTVRRINRLLRPVLRRDYLREVNARAFARETSEGLHALHNGRQALFLPAALALNGKALQIALLFLLFLAFHQPYSVGTLIAGYCIGQLFLIVSPTPSGVGFVESAMTLGLRSLHVPLESAAVITLAYRGYTFWLPFVCGMAAIRWLSASASVDALPQPD